MNAEPSPFAISDYLLGVRVRRKCFHLRCIQYAHYFMPNIYHTFFLQVLALALYMDIYTDLPWNGSMNIW